VFVLEGLRVGVGRREGVSSELGLLGYSQSMTVNSPAGSLSGLCSRARKVAFALARSAVVAVRSVPSFSRIHTCRDSGCIVA